MWTLERSQVHILPVSVSPLSTFLTGKLNINLLNQPLKKMTLIKDVSLATAFAVKVNFRCSQLLAHLSQRLTGELIG